MYAVRRASRSEFLSVRGFSYHLRSWGEPNKNHPTPLVLLHGWMDVAASWQFMVDALCEDRWIVAPDWRGFGLTRSQGLAVDSYWFPDYLGDLDALLDHIAGDRPVDLMGHSMGGNVAMTYAGVRPARVRRLVNLEGFGMPATASDQAPDRLAQWLDEIKSLKDGALDLKSYAGPESVARRLMKTNPRLTQDKADWLARQWAAPDAQGRWTILGHAAHKVVSACLYRVEEAIAAYQRIAAPALLITAGDDSLAVWWKDRFTLQEFHARISHVSSLRKVVMPEAGHMVHHDQPEALACLIENFLAAR